MDSSTFRTAMPSVTDVYTDLNGLQNLKNEKNSDEALKKVAQQFESMFINMLMKNMRSANDVFSEGNFFDTQEIKFYRDMHDNQLALTLAHNEGFGIAQAMYRQMSSDNTQSSRSREVFDPSALKYASPTSNQLIPDSARTDTASLPDDSQSVLKITNLVSQQISPDTQDQRHALADSPEDFVNKVMPYAKKAAESLDLDAEILVAQAALETGWGSKVFASDSGKPTFNLFNIKASSNWEGESVYKSSLEFLGDKFTSVASKFRSYGSIEESFEDFSNFIRGSERYQNAVNTATSGLDFIQKIHSAGYATDPAYAEKIGSVYSRVKAMVAGE